MKKNPTLIAVLLAASTTGFAVNVTVAQIDPSRLLLSQTVEAYVSVTDQEGRPIEDLNESAFRLAESPDGRSYQEVQGITAFESRSGSTGGINFLLLLDNSGSMYDTLAGKPTQVTEQMRITQAKAAVRTFLGSVTSSLDAVGLVSYNTDYTPHARPGRDTERVLAALELIRRPEPDQAYTELYAAVTLAARDFRGIAGRKAVVVLSDGENYPYARHSGKPHPLWKTRIFDPLEAIRACQEEGVSVYAINYGAEKDRNLQAIAVETGGAVFDARDPSELAGAYARIHAQVAGEYRLAYRATMAPAERKYLLVQVDTSAGRGVAARPYFASTVMGLPLAGLSPLLALALVAAALALWLLSALRLERKVGPASLEVLQTRVGTASTRLMPLTGAKTVIGSSREADLTIVGAPQVRSEQATILFDARNNSYTVVAGGEIRVNNQPVKTRKLEPGDVIDVGGTTIVFDDGR
jgi:Ca-activated chloride channel family protein